jgi:Protein of unknown function (DUF1688)
MSLNLRSPHTIRSQSQRLFDLVQADRSLHFTLDLTKLDAVADTVITIMQRDYPDGNIPFHSRWRHFDPDRVTHFFSPLDPIEKLRSQLELAIISVLLDAGAGDRWRYLDQNGKTWSRSEGLAIASFELFEQGVISGYAKDLQSLTRSTLATGLQICHNNPIIGLDGRLKLLTQLGTQLSERSVSRLSDYFVDLFDRNTIATEELFTIVLTEFSGIWAGRLTIDGIHLGDTWPHSALEPDPYIPFHKLSQWLTYSFIEPFIDMGITITDLDVLTGLAEYRNGGLFLDLGVLQLRDHATLTQTHGPSSDLIIEWRALTIVLLDQVADRIRSKLQISAETLPLVKILQGGTWTAGREIAQTLRSTGSPPLQIRSDGTVF